MTLPITTHLTRAWAYLQQAQAQARANGDAVLVQFIGQAIDDVENATIRQRDAADRQNGGKS